MTAAIAKSKAADVLERLGPFIANGDAMDSFNFFKCKREAQSAILVDPVNAYVALGLMAAMEWDVAGVHDYFGKALGIANNSMVYANYGVALRFIDAPADASDQMRLASKMAPTDLEILRAVIETRILEGKFEAALELCADYYARAGSKHSEQFRIENICEIMRHNQLGDDYTAKCHAIAYSFLQGKKIRSRSLSFKVDTEDGIVFVKIHLNLPFEQVYDLDDQLARCLIKEMPDFSPEPFWLGFDCEPSGVVQHEH